MRPEVRRDSDAAVIPGGLTPLIQTLFGKILPHPNFAVAITNAKGGKFIPRQYVLGKP